MGSVRSSGQFASMRTTGKGSLQSGLASFNSGNEQYDSKLRRALDVSHAAVCVCVFVCVCVRERQRKENPYVCE
jgi:hypothetical protein